MSSITETGFGSGFYIGLVFTLFIVGVLWLGFRLAALEEDFKYNHLRNCRKLKDRFGCNAVKSSSSWWLFTSVRYFVEIRAYVYVKITYSFSDDVFEYNNHVYHHIDPLIDQLEKDMRRSKVNEKPKDDDKIEGKANDK